MTKPRVCALALVALMSACSFGRGSSAASGGCQLTEVSGTATVKDVLAAVAATGADVLAVGTRFSGSSGGPLEAGGTAADWTAKVIPAYGSHVVEMDDVAVEPGGGAWVVGASGSAAPAIAHLVGDTWIAEDVADPGDGEDGLSGVAAASPGMAWAVGRHQDGTMFRPLIERWDGATWLAVPSPDLGSSGMLKDVVTDGPQDAWAVGWRVVDRSYRTLIEHWDGSAWSVVPTPGLGAGDAVLSGVTASGPNDVWAVGWVTSANDALRPVVERWNGKVWSVTAVPDVGRAALSAITTTPEGLVAVGRTSAGGHPFALALRYEGGVWVRIPVATAQPDQGSLTGVAVDGAGALWAVGSQQTPDGLAAALVVTGCPPT